MRIIRSLSILVALVASNAWPASAQNTPCDSAQFNDLKGMWKVTPDQNTHQVTAAELAAERKIMQRVAEMFRSSYEPHGVIGYTSVNYNTRPQIVTSKSRYGNTYVYALSNHKIECRNGKPVAIDVSFGTASVQVNVEFVGEATVGDSYTGFSYLPRGYYQLKEGIRLPQANAEGVHEFNFVDGTTVWWLTRGGALPFRYVTKREFLNKQIQLLQARSDIRPELIAYYKRQLSDATDDVAFVKEESEVPGLGGRAYVFTTLEDRANRIYVTVNPDYYDRSQSKAAPQHVLIRIRHENARSLNTTGIGQRHLESFQKLREIVRANLAELRAMVK